jgi:energy-coupling factor transporter ATP-binding protein EcfA2
MSNKINYISLTKFKGATRPFKCEFDSNKKISMIFGENGSGKSTIVDALDFVFNDKIGSLGQVSVGHSPHKYLSSIGSQLQDIYVEAKIDSNTIQGKISNNGTVTSQRPNNIPSVEILRRSQILNIILAEPKDRFSGIKKFIDVQKCQNNEDTLREAKKEVKKDKDDAYRYFQIADEQLKKLWEEDGQKQGDYLLWAVEQAKFNTTEVETYIINATEYMSKLDICSSSLSELEKFLSTIAAKQNELTDVEISYENVKKDLVKNADHLIDTLEKAKIYVEKTPDLTKCPVCEKSNNQLELLTQITERLTSYNTPITLKKKINDLNKNLQTKQIQFSTQKSNTLKGIINFIRVANATNISEIKKLNVDLNKHPTVLKALTNFYDDCYDDAIKVYNAFIKPKDTIKTQLDKYNILVKKLSAIKTNLQLRKEKETVYYERASQLNKLESLHEIAERIRKEFLDEVLDRISDSIDDYYQKIHPDENIGGIKCSMKSHGINSLDILGKFHSINGCPPAAYYSESHLDTLGICIFIALAKHYSSNGTILVLDDVLTSVDVNHLQRFIDFLSEVSKEFTQIIITTHYRFWREKYRYARGPSASIDLIELNNWSIVKGLSCSRTLTSIDELKSSLEENNYHRNTTPMLAGIMLESLLHHLVFTYNCKVGVISAHEPTVADLFYAIDGKSKNLLSVEKINEDGTSEKIELKPLFDLLEKKNMIRNKVGAHYSELGMDFPDVEVKSFGKIVKDFAEAIICEKCGEIPRSDRSGSYRECHCGHKRIHPLQLPK